jgi:hypothetical protein
VRLTGITTPSSPKVATPALSKRIAVAGKATPRAASSA